MDIHVNHIQIPKLARVHSDIQPRGMAAQDPPSRAIFLLLQAGRLSQRDLALDRNTCCSMQGANKCVIKTLHNMAKRIRPISAESNMLHEGSVHLLTGRGCAICWTSPAPLGGRGTLASDSVKLCLSASSIINVPLRASVHVRGLPQDRALRQRCVTIRLIRTSGCVIDHWGPGGTYF